MRRRRPAARPRRRAHAIGDAGKSRFVIFAGGRRLRRLPYAWLVPSAGVGSELWRVRVDLFAEDDDGRRVSAAAAALRAVLVDDDGDPVHADVGADQGLGVTTRPVVG